MYCPCLCIHLRLQQSHILLWHWGWFFGQPSGWKEQLTEVSQARLQIFCTHYWISNDILHEALEMNSFFVDCTCTGSLLEWFPELTLDSLGPHRSHDDGWWFGLPDFFDSFTEYQLGCSADLMNYWSTTASEWYFPWCEYSLLKTLYFIYNWHHIRCW